MTAVLCIIALTLGAARIAGATHIAYQAVAHVFVGGLITAGFIRGDRSRRKWCGGLAAALSILEVACAVLLR